MIDLKEFKEKNNLKFDLEYPDIVDLISLAKTKSIASNEKLFHSGEVHKNIYFVQQGILRLYYTDDKGNDITRSILDETQFVADVHSIFFDAPAKYSCECIEQAELLYMNFDDLDRIVSKILV